MAKLRERLGLRDHARERRVGTRRWMMHALLILGRRGAKRETFDRNKR